MKKLMVVTLVAGIFGLFGAKSGQAITIGFAPSTQTVNLGSLTSVDIVISDLGSEIVSAYDLDINYNSSILTATNLDFFAGLGGPLDSLQNFNLSSGLVDFAEVSFLADFELDFRQGSSVTLATIWFDTIGTGTSDLTFSFNAFNDVKGLDPKTPLIFDTINSGSIGVVPDPVPEPSTYILLGTGLAFLAYLRRRQAVDPNV